MSLKYALFSLDSYNRDAALNLTYVVDETYFNGAKIKLAQAADGGFYAIAYDTGSEIVIAYRGTEDAVDEQVGWPGGGGAYFSQQFQAANDFYERVISSGIAAGREVVFTGHSLGGGIAGFMSALTGHRAYVYDNMTFELSAKVAYVLSKIADENPFVSGDDLQYNLVSPAIRDLAQVLGLEVVEKNDGSARIVVPINNYERIGDLLKTSQFVDLFLLPGDGISKREEAEFFLSIAASRGINLDIESSDGTDFLTLSTPEYAEFFVNFDALRIAKDFFPQENSGFDTEFSNVKRFAVEGEVLTLLRYFFDADGQTQYSSPFFDGEASPENNFNFDDIANKHVASLMVLAQYFDTLSQSDKEAVSDLGGRLYDALFSENVAERLGILDGGSPDPYKALTLIAYSAAAEAETPQGTSSVQSLFSDAEDVGRVLGDVSFLLQFKDDPISAALADGIVLFSAGAAAKASSDQDIAEGFIRTDGSNLISFDYSDQLWGRVIDDTSDILGRTLVLETLGYDGYLGIDDIATRSWANSTFGSAGDDLFSRFHFAKPSENGGVDVDLGVVDQIFQLDGSVLESGDSLDVLEASGDADTITSSARNELIDLKGGNDTVIYYGSKDGNDLFIGGPGNFIGGIGNDTIEFRYNVTEYDFSIDDFTGVRDITVTHARGSGEDGTVTLFGFETLDFADSTWEFTFGEDFNEILSKPGDGNSSDTQDTGGADGGSGESDGDDGSGNGDGGDTGSGNDTGGDDSGSNTGGGNSGGDTGGGTVETTYSLEVLYPGDSGAVTEPDAGSARLVRVEVVRTGDSLPEETLYVSTLSGHSSGAFPAASAADKDYFGKIGATESVVVFEKDQEIGSASFVVRGDNQEEGIEAFRLMLRDDQVNTTADPLAIQDVYIRDNETQEPPADDTGSGGGTGGGDQGGGGSGSGGTGGSSGDPSVGFNNGVEIRIVEVDTSNPTPGGSASVKIEIENTASASKLVTRLGIYFSEDDTPSRGELVGTYFPGVVAPGEIEDRRISFIIPENASGTARIIVVDEDELNDPSQAAISEFSVSTPSSRADVTIASHHLNDTTLTFGQTVEAEYWVRNVGLAESGRGAVDIYLSRNSSFNEEDDIRLIGDYFGSNRNGIQKGIDAGGLDPEAENFTITADMVQELRGSLDPTNLYVLFVVDEDREIDDADRSNNVVATRVSVAATEEEITGYTDHEVSDFGISSDEILYGERFGYSFTVSNSGNIDAAAHTQFTDLIWRNVETGVEYIYGAQASSYDFVLEPYIRRNDYFVNFELSVNENTIPAGEYDVFARTRTDDAEPADLLENNDSNSVRVVVGSEADIAAVGAPEISLAELVVESTETGELRVSFEVSNLSPVPLNDVLPVLLSVTPSSGGTARIIETFFIPGLSAAADASNPNTFRTPDFSVQLPDDLPDGAYEVSISLVDGAGGPDTANDFVISEAVIVVGDDGGGDVVSKGTVLIEHFVGSDAGGSGYDDFTGEIVGGAILALDGTDQTIRSAESATQFTFFNPDQPNRVTVVTGRDFTYDTTGPLSGVIEKIDFFDGSLLLASMSDLAIVAIQMTEALQGLTNENYSETFSTLLQGYNLSYDASTASGAVKSPSGFQDGEASMTGSDFDDALQGTLNDDTFVGGAGNDSLIDPGFGEPGGYDTYIFAADWGEDHILDFDLAGKLQFDGYAEDELSMSNEAGDLVISAGTNFVRFQDYYSLGAGYDFVFSDPPDDGTTEDPDGEPDNPDEPDDQVLEVKSGDSGDNFLDGRGGSFRLEGGLGDDSYFIDDQNDEVFELPGEGTDYVWAEVDYDLAKSALEIEQLQLVGDEDLAGYGNDHANTIWGNSGNNQIDGRHGDDTLQGEVGDDTLFDAFGSDLLFGGSGEDRLVTLSGSNQMQGGEGADVLIGGSGRDFQYGQDGDDILIGDLSETQYNNDYLDGGKGDDLLQGGLGADKFVFRPNGGTDTIGRIAPDYSNWQNSTVDGPDFQTGVDGIWLQEFGYETSTQVLNKISDVNGMAQFSDQGTTIWIEGVLKADLDEWDFVV